MILWKIARLRPEVGEEALPLLEEYAQHWLRVPKVTLTEWAKLDVLERAALVRAAEKERIEQEAAEDPMAAAVRYVKFDGGRAYRLLTLTDAVRAAAAARTTYGA